MVAGVDINIEYERSCLGNDLRVDRLGHASGGRINLEMSCRDQMPEFRVMAS